MKSNTRKWLHGLIAAGIGGGASAVTSGLTSMGFAPDKFNLTDARGVWHLLALMGVNFLVSGILSIAFYLRQAPLPPESETEFVSKPAAVTAAPLHPKKNL